VPVVDWTATLHVGSAAVSGAAAIGVTLAAGLAAAGGTVSRRTLDRLLLVGILATLAAIVSGPLLLAEGRVITDPLHALYGAIALLAGPVTRGAAMRDTVRPCARAGSPVPPAVGRWMVAGGLVTLGALLRLWMTGG